MLSKVSSSTSTLTTSIPPTSSRKKSIEPTLTDLSQNTQSTQSTLSQRRSSDSIIDIISMDIKDNSSLVEHEHLVERNTHISDQDYDTSPALDGKTDSSHVTLKDFNYSITLINKKINALYEICRFISSQQQENLKSLNKLVALDELSDGFWNKSVKKLLPDVLFPTHIEYRDALEEYLSVHASHFIESIGRNSWVSLFGDKIFAEIKNKGQSKRNDIAAHICNAMFATFGKDRLERIDNNTSPVKITEWKNSEKTKKAYEKLFMNHKLLSKISYSVFRSHKEEELSTMHCAYILFIYDILLNPKSSGIKCNDRSITRRVHAFLRAFEKNNPAMPQMMEEIAEAEEKEAEETTKRKKQKGSQENRIPLQMEGETTIDDDEEYDDFFSNLDYRFSRN
ncbi:hypothetical protein RclHR1_03020014 [Rhizophagus clarus]|uniref:Uncharacterized protein n=1 Tax=Rhizophagus clarus TaxID=94130 RepID=A0A2Z6RZY0_9GLOM|nr:hypothetical protein RclHR1_03020014 [Rhizophagus clarus]